MSALALGRFLARRMAESGVDPGGTLTVQEVRGRLVPYRACRGELDLATKAEYDLALLSLLREPELVEVMDQDLREAVERELASPEPELAVLDGFGSAVVSLGPGLGGRRRGSAKEPPRAPTKPAARARAGSAGTKPAAATATPEPRGRGPAEGRPEAPTGPTASERAACPACGAELPAGREVRYCPFCGADQETPRCGGCGEALEAEWRYCPACGRAADT